MRIAVVVVIITVSDLIKKKKEKSNTEILKKKKRCQINTLTSALFVKISSLGADSTNSVTSFVTE